MSRSLAIGLPRQWAATPAGAATMLVAGISLVHLLVAGRFDLSVDEAHYALYGYLADWSYFDHPPMVGWLQALALRFGEDEFTLRLWPILFSALASGVLYRLTRELFPGESAWLAFGAVVFLQSAVVYQLLGLALVPDGPLLLFALAGALFLARGLEKGRTADWVLVGMFFGLAGLSKYTAVTLVISALIAISWERRWGLLRTPGPWLALFTAAILIAPVLWWNFQHDWVSLRYQLGHGAPNRSWEVTRFLNSQARQLLAYSPGIYLFGLTALAGSVGQWRSDRGVRFCTALAAPVLLLFGWGSGFEETLPHWTLFAWAAAAPLAVRWIVRRWEGRPVRFGVKASLAYSLFFALLIHSQLFAPWIPFQAHRNPFGDLIGWREAAERAEMLLGRLGGGGEPPPRLFVGNWSLASRIAWYARPRPVLVTDHRFDQFDLWFGSPREGSVGILVVPDTYFGKPDKSGKGKFDRCALIDRLTVERDRVPVHTFRFYRCEGYRH